MDVTHRDGHTLKTPWGGAKSNGRGGASYRGHSQAVNAILDFSQPGKSRSPVDDCVAVALFG